MNPLVQHNTGVINELQMKAKMNLINDVLEKSSVYLKGTQLMELNKILNEILDGYEIFVDNKMEYNTNYIEDNQMILEHFVNTKKVEGASPRTIVYYETTIRKLIEWIDCPLADVEANLIREYLQYHQNRGKCSNTTLDNVRRVFSTFFTFCNDEGFIQRNPMRKVKKIKSTKKVKKAFTDFEIEEMREYLNKLPERTKLQKYLKLRDNAIFELLLSSGVRIKECVALNREDIDLDNRSFLVLGKGDKERLCYFSVKAAHKLKKLLDFNPPKQFRRSNALFQGKGGVRWGVNGVERRIREMGQDLGIHAHPHKFRRTFATNLIRKEVPIEQVREMMGHSNLDTTLIYTEIDQEQVKMNHNKYSN
ncbi:MAG: tyrosine-type recombinase/integrase [Methanobrevibacter sp.]|nr:tyrosine-type recombinase/integrase [Methanobrevibacter sp.]MBQ9024922.1 tyrosine-type recombinase/integrase [Methanobrevibacter sp.]